MALLLLSVFFYIIVTISPTTLPAIIWDPRNYLFACENITINIRQGNDKLPFFCGTLGLNTEGFEGSQNEIYEKIVVSDKKYQVDSCNSTGARQLLDCSKAQKWSEQFSTFKGWVKGETYYFFSTSYRKKENLDQRINGSCVGEPPNYYPLKLGVHLCEDCPICNSFECYTKGCGKWSEWIPQSSYYWNGTACVQKMTRNCMSNLFKCDGAKTKFIATNSTNCKLYKEVCPTRVFPSFSIHPTKSSNKMPTCSAIVKTSVVFNQTNVTITQPPTTEYINQTIYINQTGSFSLVKVTETNTVTKTETEKASTETKTLTETVKTTITVTINGTGSKPQAEKIIFRDVDYDKKFYITVSSAIIGAILTGIFVTHAILCYCEGNQLYYKVYLKDYREAEVMENGHENHSKEIIYEEPDSTSYNANTSKIEVVPRNETV